MEAQQMPSAEITEWPLCKNEKKLEVISSSSQETNSSSIESSDCTDDDSIDGKTIGTWPAGAVANPGILTTKLVMPDQGQFNARLFHVSHSQVDGLFFPEAPVPIVARIRRSAVLDYVNKMKKRKDIIVMVFRLAPDHPSDTKGYMSLFSYFSARRRFGLLGGITAPLKGAYLVPQERQLPINRALLPYKGGPGLPAEADRVNCLLAVVIRHKLPPAYHLVALSKRLSSSSSFLSSAEVILPKKQKLTPVSEGLGVRLVKLNTILLPISASAPSEKTQAQLLIEELNARIEKEKQEIETISADISNNEFCMRLSSRQEKPAPRIFSSNLTPLLIQPTPQKTAVAEVIGLDDQFPPKSRRPKKFGEMPKISPKAETQDESLGK